MIYLENGESMAGEKVFQTYKMDIKHRLMTSLLLHEYQCRVFIRAAKYFQN